MSAPYDYPVTVMDGHRTPVRSLWPAGISGQTLCAWVVAEGKVCRRPSEYVLRFVDHRSAGACAEHAARARQKYDLLHIETYVEQTS